VPRSEPPPDRAPKGGTGAVPKKNLVSLLAVQVSGIAPKKAEEVMERRIYAAALFFNFTIGSTASMTATTSCVAAQKTK
jgi:hypothetical protein